MLLVDDDPLVRSGLRLIIETADDLSVVGEAGDGDEVVAACRAAHPDVVLMDLRMPRLDGIAATRAVAALPDAPQVIALTTWDVDDAVVRALEAGAAGFLLKGASFIEILDAVRAVARGDSVLSPRSTRQLLDHLASREPDGSDGARRLVADLSPRERDVAVAVGRGLSNAEIAQELYLSEATVKTHLGSAQSKLGVRNRVGVAVLAERAGLLRG